MTSWRNVSTSSLWWEVKLSPAVCLMPVQILSTPHNKTVAVRHFITNQKTLHLNIFLVIWKLLFSVLAVWDCSYKVKVWFSKNTDICNSCHSFLSVCLPGFVSRRHSLQMSCSSVVKSKNASLTSTKNLKTVCLHLCITTRQGYNKEEHSNDEIMLFYNVRWLTGFTVSFQNEAGKGQLSLFVQLQACKVAESWRFQFWSLSHMSCQSPTKTAPHKTKMKSSRLRKGSIWCSRLVGSSKIQEPALPIVQFP